LTLCVCRINHTYITLVKEFTWTKFSHHLEEIPEFMELGMLVANTETRIVINELMTKLSLKFDIES
jgi:hypothetical protein